MELGITPTQKKKKRKITCCKHSLKCKHKSKWRHKWAECGNCTSIPILDTGPLSDDDETLQNFAKREMPQKLTKAEILRKFSRGVLPAAEKLRNLSKGESQKTHSTEKLIPTDILRKLSTGEGLTKFAFFPALQPCGCNRDKTNTNDHSTCNIKQMSRSLCELTTDESYMSCRNCSPVSSETVGYVTSEDSESCIISGEVGNQSDLLQDIVSNGSFFDSKHQQSDPMEEIAFKSSNFGSNYDLPYHVGRVDSPTKEPKDLKFKRCGN